MEMFALNGKMADRIYCIIVESLKIFNNLNVTIKEFQTTLIPNKEKKKCFANIPIPEFSLDYQLFY